MNEKLKKYLDGIFASYKDSRAIIELKEELSNDLQEKFNDFKGQGYDDDTAYNMTVDSIGDIKEIISTIEDDAKKAENEAVKDLSKMYLKNSDFKGVSIQSGKFDASDLRESDFSGSDLKESSFKYSDLRNEIFDGANLSMAKFIMSDLRSVSLVGSDLTAAKFSMCDLREANFKNCIFNNTEFDTCDITNLSFDNQTFNGTVFKKSGLKDTSFKNAVFRNVLFKYCRDVKKANFDGATMDKLTYATLKSSKANLDNVTII